MNFDINREQIGNYKDIIISYALEYIPTFLLAIIVLRVGLKVIKRATKHIRNGLQRGNFEATVSKFLGNLANYGLKALLIITVAGMVGVETASFVAMIGAAGLAVGLALQGSLANFAGGVLILIFKPYQVGDFVEIYGEEGKVQEIDILLTKIVTRDNKLVIIPNGKAVDDKIVNRSKKGFIRIDVPVGIGYNMNIDKAKETLEKVLSESDYIADDEKQEVLVMELGDSSVNLMMRGYGTAADYQTAYSQLMEDAKKALDTESIEIPFPQRVVHMADKG